MATPTQIVEEVLANKWGTGETRKQKLKEAGYSWIEIQSLINLQYGGRSVQATDEEIAQEVLENRWGTGTDRKERITAAGFNYTNIQKIVNQLVAQGGSSSNSNTTPAQTNPTPTQNNKKFTLSSTIQSKGIDISAWQGTVDFNRVKSSGVQFVILREGYSTVADSKFFEYVKGANAAGLYIPAVYHFCYATNEAGAIMEAQSCIANVTKAGLPKSTILFFDFEYDTINNARKKGVNLGRTQCIAFSKAFCNTVLAQGFNTGIYCNLDYYNNMYDQATLNAYNLWIAQYTKGAPKVKGIYHQHSDTGRVNGINGNVDLDNCYIVAAAPTTSSSQEKETTTSSSAPALNTDFTKYYGKISNCGKDENGGARGGRAGDQSGKEWWIINWYNQGWQCILRHPDAKVREYIATLGIQAAQNDNVGYDQSENQTYWHQLQKVGYWPKDIKTPCEADCSAGVIANVKAVGHLLNIDALKNITATYTGNMRASFRSAGFTVLTESKYLGSPNYLLPGDIILNDAQHTATNLGYGKNAEIPKTNVSIPKEESTTSEHRVTAILLNVRSSPSLQGKIVGQLIKGTPVNIKDTIKNDDGAIWYQIDQGYVVAQYIS